MKRRSHLATLSLSLWIGIGGCAGKQPSAAATPGVPASSATAGVSAPAANSTPAPATSAASEPPTSEPPTSEPPTASALPRNSSLYESVVGAPDRTPEDRALDAGRHPIELLEFLAIQPGMRVAEISAGRGYTAELLARTVGPSGKVYAHNSKFILERYAEKPWSERLRKPVMKNVVRVDREFEDPLPPEAKNLDLVLDNLFYHDTVWMKVNRDKMNRAIYAALRPGGAYVIIDHSGRTGTGTSEAETLHRIEEKVVRDEVQKAGFRLASEGTFLRNPNDARDWSASPRTAGEKRGTSDRFILKYVKP